MSDEEQLGAVVPIVLEWVLDKNFIDEEIKRKADNYIYTKFYKFPGFPLYHYHMVHEIYTKPNEDEQTFLFTLYFNGPDGYKLDADLNFTINDEEQEHISQICEYDDYGVSLLNNLSEELNVPENNYFINNQLTLRIDGSVTFLKFANQESPRIKGRHVFWKLYNEDASKDSIIEVEKKEIKVHKNVLQNYSTVFSAMFENGWKESIENRVIIPEFPFRIVDMVIKLCYNSNSDTDNLQKYDLCLLFQFADKYDMKKVIDAITDVIPLTPNNICEYANFFYEQNYVELVNYCIDRLIVYFQYSYSVKNLDSLNMDIKVQFFTRASESDAMKKEISLDYFKNHNDKVNI